jgi:hypothetical protein
LRIYQIISSNPTFLFTIFLIVPFQAVELIEFISTFQIFLDHLIKFLFYISPLFFFALPYTFHNPFFSIPLPLVSFSFALVFIILSSQPPHLSA